MTENTERPLVSSLRNRLTGPASRDARFANAPVDIEDLQALELGALWADMGRAAEQFNAPGRAWRVASAIREQAQEKGLKPALTEAAALDALERVLPGQWAVAAELFTMLAQAPTPALAAEARRVLGKVELPPYAEDDSSLRSAIALAVMAGQPAVDELREVLMPRASESPYWRSELDVMPELGLEALMAMIDDDRNALGSGSLLPPGDASQALATEPAFVLHAQQLLARAAEGVRAIHGGEVPYKADGAFTKDDAWAISRAMRVAARRDEPWLGPVIQQLLPGVCVAPTAAKTLPSQAVAIALGKIIEALPTPETVEALKAALAVVRHDGIAKKLARHLKPAERGLAERPEVALRMTSAPKDRQRSAMLATCLEAGLWRGLELPVAAWRERLADAPGGQEITRALVWVATRPDGSAHAFMLAGRDGAAVDAEGRPVALGDDARMSLWHPVTAGADSRHQWQAAVVASRLRQPFRQVFREHYALPAGEADAKAASMFAGHVLSLGPLLGLASREGWRADRYRGLVREFGAVRVAFAVDAPLYPGIRGSAPSGALTFERRDERQWRACALATVEPVLFSEVCRAVDLLVSACGFALHDGPVELPPGITGVRLVDTPPGHSLAELAQARRDALSHVFADAIADGRMSMTARHLHVGDHAVHLATARVTRHGEPVDLGIAPAPAEPRLATVPWLPYDETLLQRIAESAGQLLAAR